MRRDDPEDRIHCRVVALLREAGLGPTDFFHSPNGGATSKREGGRRKARGVAPGVPDLIFTLPPPSRAHLVAAIELKAPRGRMSPAQIAWRDAHVPRGWLYATVGDRAKSEDEAVSMAVAVLQRWGYLS